MSIRMRTFTLCVATMSSALLCAGAAAQGRGPAAPAPQRAGGAPQAARPAAQQVHGNLLQVMRGILFPNSNVIFAAQTQDPGTYKKDPDPALSVNPLASMYGEWQAIENSGLALAESANLLTIPGRMCANGKPVPVQAADWQQFVRGLRAAGMTAYKAGQSKNMDMVLEAADSVATACANCHDVYREKTPAQGGMAARCTK